MTYQEATSAMKNGKLVKINGLVFGMPDTDGPLMLYVNGKETTTAYVPFPVDLISNSWELYVA